MNANWLLIPALQLIISTVMAQSGVPARTGAFIIIQEQTVPGRYAGPIRFQSDVVLTVTDTLPPPPVRNWGIPVRPRTLLKIASPEKPVPDAFIDDSNTWRPGLIFGSGQHQWPVYNRVYVSLGLG